MRRYSLPFMVTIVFPLASAVGARADGVHIGRSPQGQLLVEVEQEFTGFIALTPIDPGGLFSGWSGSDPGFTNEVDKDVDEDFLPLESGAAIWLEVVTIDPAFLVIGTDFEVLEAPGDQTFIGNADALFDTHVTYIIDADDAAFDEAQCVWDVTLIVRDVGATGYAPSDAFTLRFTSTPEHAATGDADGNGTVNLVDFAALHGCLLGPDAPPDGANGLCGPVCISTFDADADGDVDLRDVAWFQRMFTGP